MVAEIERVLWIALGGLIAAIAGYFGSYFKEMGKTTPPGRLRRSPNSAAGAHANHETGRGYDLKGRLGP